VFLSPGIFDLYSTITIWGSGSSTEIQELRSRMINYPIPFNSSLKINDNDEIYWYLHLPPTHLSDLLFHLRHIMTDLHFTYIDYVRAKNYLIWPPTFDEEKKDWQKDDVFMIDNVINATDEKIDL
jgi:hypothetical protein